MQRTHQETTGNPQQNLGPDAIKEVLAAKKRYNFKNTHLVVITNYKDFTSSAKELAKEEDVKLVNRDDLSLWPNHII